MAHTTTPKGETIFLHNNVRPSYTGQGLNKTSINFLTKPKTMAKIADTLFKGDMWAANHWQTRFIGNGTLKINENATIQIIDWDRPIELIDFKKINTN
jgi:hypothetical protein